MTKSELLNNAKRIAESLGHAFIGTEHILTAYYIKYNPDIAVMLIKRIKERIGIGTPSNLNLLDDRSPSAIRIIKKYNSTNEIILAIITDLRTPGAQFLRR